MVAQGRPQTPPVSLVAQGRPQTPPVSLVAQGRPQTPPVSLVAQGRPQTTPVSLVAQGRPQTTSSSVAQGWPNYLLLLLFLGGSGMAADYLLLGSSRTNTAGSFSSSSSLSATQGLPPASSSFSSSYSLVAQGHLPIASFSISAHGQMPTASSSSPFSSAAQGQIPVFSRTSMWRRIKKTGPVPTTVTQARVYKCKVCCLPMTSKGHSQFRGQRYCPHAVGQIPKEQWLTIMRQEALTKTAAKQFFLHQHFHLLSKLLNLYQFFHVFLSIHHHFIYHSLLKINC